MSTLPTKSSLSFPTLESAVENGFDVETDDGVVYVVKKACGGGRWLRAIVPHAERRATPRAARYVVPPAEGRWVARRIA